MPFCCNVSNLFASSDLYHHATEVCPSCNASLWGYDVIQHMFKVLTFNTAIHCHGLACHGMARLPCHCLAPGNAMVCHGMPWHRHAMPCKGSCPLPSSAWLMSCNCRHKTSTAKRMNKGRTYKYTYIYIIYIICIQCIVAPWCILGPGCPYACCTGAANRSDSPRGRCTPGLQQGLSGTCGTCRVLSMCMSRSADIQKWDRPYCSAKRMFIRGCDK